MSKLNTTLQAEMKLKTYLKGSMKFRLVDYQVIASITEEIARHFLVLPIQRSDAFPVTLQVEVFGHGGGRALQGSGSVLKK